MPTKKLSVLITHYNRPKALQKCLEAILKLNFNCLIELVVSDDGSEPENLRAIQQLQIDHLVTTSKNQGLASNLNRGIKACTGDFIMYVQEDFIIKPEILNVLPESMDLISNGQLDMVRYRANYVFQHLIPVSQHIFRIPRFSFKNFNINTFQYSDNPFLTTRSFFESLDYFLENTSGPYGETEFAIRVLKSKAKIGIADKNYFAANTESSSVMVTTTIKRHSGFKRKLKRFARAVRQHVEWLCYNPRTRKLLTYSNARSVN